jgi:hypothetical protein
VHKNIFGRFGDVRIVQLIYLHLNKSQGVKWYPMVTIQALTRPGTHVPVASIFLPGSRDWTGSEPGTVLTAECNQVTINMGYHMVSGDMVYGDMVFNKSKTT